VNDILKQRLVGALILVALGVIFWPIIFVQPESADVAEPRAIPDPPGVAVAPIEAPDDAGLRDAPESVALQQAASEVPGESIDVLPEPDEEELAELTNSAAAPSQPGADQQPVARVEAPQPLQMDSDGVPVAWTLQVATLSSADKADDLRRRLLALEHKAYVVSIRRDGKTLYRVCVGPGFERAKVERLKTEVDSKFGVKSLVARYVPQ